MDSQCGLCCYNEFFQLRTVLKNKMVESVNISPAADTFCPQNHGTTCSDCGLAAICLPIALEATEIDSLDDIVQRNRPLQKGDHLFRENDAFSSVYAVRSGALKAYRITNDGKEQVTSFALPGEILGMDAIGNNKHASSAVALETAAICEIPFNMLDELSSAIPLLRRRFYQLMSEKITSDQQLITLLGKNTAEQRVSTLLLSISARHARQKLSATKFNLPMSRIDIGNYFGLTVETVSRVFGRLQKLGLIKVRHKQVEILKYDEFRAIASGGQAKS